KGAQGRCLHSVGRIARFPWPSPFALGLVEAFDRIFDDPPRLLDVLRRLLLLAREEASGHADLVREDLGAQVAEDLEQARRRIEELAVLIELDDQLGEAAQVYAQVLGRDVVVESHAAAHIGFWEGDTSAATVAGSDASTAAPAAGAGHGRYRMNVE